MVGVWSRVKFILGQFNKTYPLIFLVPKINLQKNLQIYLKYLQPYGTVDPKPAALPTDSSISLHATLPFQLLRPKILEPFLIPFFLLLHIQSITAYPESYHLFPLFQYHSYPSSLFLDYCSSSPSTYFLHWAFSACNTSKFLLVSAPSSKGVSSLRVGTSFFSLL